MAEEVRWSDAVYALNNSIEIKIDTSDRLVDLVSENIDVAIRFSLEPGPGNEALDLYRGYYLPVCSPGFAAAHGLNPDCRDLTGVRPPQLERTKRWIRSTRIDQITA